MAYFGFELYETMYQFIKKFHNFTIQDEKGKSYNLSVQRAIYQSLPMDKKKMHPLISTITQTDDYLQFIDKINNKNIKPVEEVKKEELKVVDIKEASTVDEPTSQSASVENSPEKK